MIELSEAINLARQLQETIVGKTVNRVCPPTKIHKLCWYSGDPAEYDERLSGHRVSVSEGFGMFVEMTFNNGQRLCVSDGINLRFVQEPDVPKDYQLKVEFSDKTALVFTVAMYGGILLHDGTSDNVYYIKSRNAISPFSPKFSDYYHALLAESKPTLSAKAFLATEQRFPGIGNGVLQDILFVAHVNPKKKIANLTRQEIDMLLSAMVSVLREMTALGGRDTEKDLLGKNGGYKTLMSKNTVNAGCPGCGGKIVKEAFMGGSVYYCLNCQPI